MPISTLLDKAKKNGLFYTMVVGTMGYEVFAHTECLFPIMDAVGPLYCVV